LVLVSGLHRESTAQLSARLMCGLPATAVVHHDLRRIADGVVRRRIRFGRADTTTTLTLAHGCVSCTLRNDLLPLLRTMSADPRIERVVLHLDPMIEQEAVCWALENVLVGTATISEIADIEACMAVVDPRTWLTDATGDAQLSEHGIGAVDDRTLAQVAVGQVDFADAVVTSGVAEPWAAAKVDAVLDRLVPGTPRVAIGVVDPVELLAAVAPGARRGRADGPHGPLLRGQPPLAPDCGVSVTLFRDHRPFHPERLHHAIDVLLDGVVRGRGRVWVASQPNVALWLESAGGGLRVGHAGAWLAAVDDAAWDRAPAERRAKAALDWHPRFGDRVQELVVIAHEANPDDITAALARALLTDEELAAGEQAWLAYPDPFGDPCAVTDLGVPAIRKEES
jgi:G3E family GTPase